jgi:hypothetical protein
LNLAHGGRREVWVIDFELDNSARVPIPVEHLGERRHARRPQVVGTPFANRPVQRRRAIQRAIVMDHDDAVSREADVELDAVGAERQAFVECGQRVLRREPGAAAMREDQGPIGGEEWMALRIESIHGGHLYPR